jgi:hypothetical protein
MTPQTGSVRTPRPESTRPAPLRRPGPPGFGTGDLTTALSLASGWVVNAVVAEWVIRRPGARTRTASAGSR